MTGYNVPEPTRKTERARVSVSIRWGKGGPRFWNPNGPTKEQAERAHARAGGQRRIPTHDVEWETMTASATMPVNTYADVYVSGSGWYLRGNGQLGKRRARMEHIRLDDIDSPDVRAFLWEGITQAERNLAMEGAV